MINLQNLDWDRNYITRNQAEAIQEGYRITINRDRETGEWALTIIDLENRGNIRYAYSGDTTDHQVFDELFGQGVWQAFLQDCAARWEQENLEAQYLVAVDTTAGEAVILKPGRENSNTGLMSYAALHEQIATYDEAKAIVTAELAGDFELVEDTQWREYYRLVTE